MNFLRWAWAKIGAGCGHGKRTGVFHDEDGQYQRCLLCGRRLEYDLIQFAKATPPPRDAA